MTTLSRQYKLSKTSCFTYYRGMGVNRGKWQQILGEDRKVGEGGHAFEYDKQTKVHFVSEHFLLSC
jgi:hypothetical protein